jgi:hypothetical protein
MKRTKPIPKELKRLQKQFTSWRKKPPKRKPFPKELWESAIKLAADLSVSQVSHFLKLDYCKLKERTAKASQTALPVALNHGFVEVPVGSIAQPSQCQIQVINPSGAKMTIDLNHGRGIELNEIVQTFCRS